ncbi:hypothetical protein BH11BAC4_BH11BAC4_01650 [soil metagenome]
MIGERIHSYEINAHLGQGGMGNVYRGTDTMLGREVALKMLHPQLTMQSQFLERFKKEARVLAQLLHPNIAVIYNFIEQGGNHFMVMEYVEGTSLDELLKMYTQLPAAFVVPVFIQALEGLQHAHRKNIFHRDIKPSNLMITADGTLKLMDFGIAKVAGEQKMTQVNKIVGTIEFMAPELIEGKDASIASDVYSMGATLYELVSGKLPFEADTDFNLMQAILKKKAITPDKLNASVPKKLSEIIQKAMDKTPAHRYPDARSFQQALITAFPVYREIDMNLLRRPSPVPYASAGAATKLNSDKMTTEAMQTRMERVSGAGNLLQSSAKKILSNRKNQLILAALLLFLVVAVLLLNSNNPAAQKEAYLTAQADSLNLTGKNSTGNAAVVSDPGRVIEPVHQPETPKQQTVNFQEEPVKGKEQPKKTEIPVKRTEPVVPVQSLVDKQPEVVAPVQPERKDVYVSRPNVEVSLSLRSNPDMNQKQKEEQRVSFSVTRAVVFDGVTIIRQGAIATGSITIGRVMTDISIDNVEAANGKRISLRAAKAHGRRSDVESNRSYTAYIQAGTRINF